MLNGLNVFYCRESVILNLEWSAVNFLGGEIGELFYFHTECIANVGQAESQRENRRDDKMHSSNGRTSSSSARVAWPLTETKWSALFSILSVLCPDLAIRHSTWTAHSVHVFQFHVWLLLHCIVFSIYLNLKLSTVIIFHFFFVVVYILINLCDNMSLYLFSFFNAI